MFDDLIYVPETGDFYWKEPGPARRLDGRAGHKGPRYWHLSCYGEAVLAHRLAFYKMTGRWPVEIDHINRDGHDNRWCNLRECTRSENQYNRNGWGKLPKHIYNDKGKFRVMKKIDGKFKSFGNYTTLEEALAVRDKLE